MRDAEKQLWEAFDSLKELIAAKDHVSAVFTMSTKLNYILQEAETLSATIEANLKSLDDSTLSMQPCVAWPTPYFPVFKTNHSS